jgi:hypothetical protein
MIIKKKHLIVLLFVLSNIFLDDVISQCNFYENTIYQVTSTFPNYEPAYSILTLLNTGLFYEINNIANGQNTGEMGVDIQFSTLMGYYQCLNANTIHLTAFGYVYKNTNIAVLSTIDLIFYHDYYLYFSDVDKTNCTGQVSYTFFVKNSSPFDSGNQPVFSGLVANLTCVLLNGRHYVWPTISP